jgi:hypothetical protein
MEGNGGKSYIFNEGSSALVVSGPYINVVLVSIPPQRFVWQPFWY